MRIGNIFVNTTMQSILDTLIMDCNNSGKKLFSKGYKEINGYYIVQCPYHKFGQEHKPSAQFRATDGYFFCFGCKESHPLPQVIYDCLGVDGRAWLLEHFDGDSDESRQGFGFKKRTTEEQNFVNPDILKRFDKTHPYMFQRKLNMEIIKKFNIGYDEEHKCITFPVKDLLGRIVFIATRSVEKKFFHYPSDVDKPIYGLYEIYEEMKNGKQIDEVYICESMINCLTLWVWGKYAVALNGTGSSTQLEMLKKSSIRHFILALDNDNAGKKGTEKLIKELKSNKILEKINFKDERDVNDLSFEEFNELVPEKVTLL